MHDQPPECVLSLRTRSPSKGLHQAFSIYHLPGVIRAVRSIPLKRLEDDAEHRLKSPRIDASSLQRLGQIQEFIVGWTK